MTNQTTPTIITLLRTWMFKQLAQPTYLTGHFVNVAQLSNTPVNFSRSIPLFNSLDMKNI